MKFAPRQIALAALASVAGLGVVLVLTGKLPALKRAAPPAETAQLATAISVVKVEPQDFTATLLVTGTLVPRDEILVGPEVEGLRVVEVLADEGDKVKKGQVLARLVNDTLDAQLAQNAAGLAKATAAIQQARSNIASAEAKLVEARNTLERGKPLRQGGYMSEATLDQRAAAAKTAEAAVAAAKDALAVAEAEKAQVEAVRRELSWKRGRTEIAAPADGVVSRRVARIGGFAAGLGDPMFRIIARGEIELDAEVPEIHLTQLRPGQSARVELPDGSTVAGKVRLVSPEIDKASRLGRIRVSLDESPALRIGAFGMGTVTVATSRGLAVPSSALKYGEGLPSVQVVADNKVDQRAVKVGLAADGLTEIRDGLTEGDMVVAKAGTFLRAGDLVRPVIQASRKMTDAGRGALQ